MVAKLYVQSTEFGEIAGGKMAWPYAERSLSILNNWLSHFDSIANDNLYRNKKSLREERKISTLRELVSVESQMACVMIDSRQFDAAEGHCQRCLAHSKRLKPEGENISRMYAALRTYFQLREHQLDYAGALPYAEEAYNLVVIAYDCVHPEVQTAAGLLIKILIKLEDLVNAERYAQVTLGNLRDKKNGMDQEGAELAQGLDNVAYVIYRQHVSASNPSEIIIEEVLKAEKYAREALRIRIKLDGSDSHRVGMSCLLLARILLLTSNLGDETLELFKRSLAIVTRHEGPRGVNGGTANINLGQVYCARAEIQPTAVLRRPILLLAKPHFEAGVAINTALYGTNHPYTFDGTSRLAW
eukprot:CAMPEP_0119035184 /NCGR_PEP_ID=MMETSP1177-20130426/2132_1 /TAXON_ID=2985 /ORGANISM="Ochromonas sp, Strain CCMP1899" /LENGTH=356 /DNA_ID=CAMNT_0006993141 /DNA_START=382 /DNA_END=1449 /DNA_ORIENTATION=+